MAQKKMTTASVLAFERKLDISDAFFWQKNSNVDDKNDEVAIVPVAIREKSVRGTISNRLKKAVANDPAKLDAEIEKPNLQTVDAAALDVANDTLVARWSCKVLPFTGEPYVCNDQEYQQVVTEKVRGYLEEYGVKELARRYASNIANARWLWRNRMGAEEISVTVTKENQSITFSHAEIINLNDFSYTSPELDTLTEWIAAGLSGQAYTILYIEGEAKVGYGQEVYPSQELILDTGNRKSKVLYQVDNKAGVHSQKIGNAIRTIDTWYEEDAPFPIAVEPYGSVTTLGMAFRQPRPKKDFYSIFDAWMKDNHSPTEDEQHYVMAILIRGGVFGESSKG